MSIMVIQLLLDVSFAYIYTICMVDVYMISLRLMYRLIICCTSLLLKIILSIV